MGLSFFNQRRAREVEKAKLEAKIAPIVEEVKAEIKEEIEPILEEPETDTIEEAEILEPQKPKKKTDAEKLKRK